jgi:PncC family amidohydrolase
MQQLVESLKRNNWLLASCESVTGGDFASSITDVNGASEVYLGGYIVYSDLSKQKLAFVDEEMLKTFGSVSAEVVRSMAIWTKDYLKSDVSIAFSGNAGPGGSSNQPVGRVFTAIAIYQECFVYQDDFSGSRKDIKRQIVDRGKQRLLDLIHKENMR